MVKLKADESSGADYELIPEGQVVPVRLENVEPHSFKVKDETVHKLNWFFTVVEQGDWYGKTLRGQTSQVFVVHPNCKAYNWAVAISGKRYAEGEELDTDDILGMPCQVIIKHREGGDDRVWMDVRDVLPPSRSGGAPAPAADQSPF